MRPFITEEVKMVMFQFSLDKTPHPNGFNTRLFQKIWDSVGGDMTKFVLSFFERDYLLKAMNQILTFLIPEGDFQQPFKD